MLSPCSASWTCQTCCSWQVGLAHMIITLGLPPHSQVNTRYKSPWAEEVTLETRMKGAVRSGLPKTT